MQDNFLSHFQEHFPHGRYLDTPNAVGDRTGSLTNPDAGTADEAQILQQRQSVAVNDPLEAHDRPDKKRSMRTTVSYTRTGRLSKAKCGLKVYECECGRSYTRAEHLRRHQRNHTHESAWVCGIAGCCKKFYREDLYQRHCERHNELDLPISQEGAAFALKNQAYPEKGKVPAPESSSHDHGHDLEEEAELEPSYQWDTPTPQLTELVTPEHVDSWGTWTHFSSNEMFHPRDMLAYSSASVAPSDCLDTLLSENFDFAVSHTYAEAQSRELPKTSKTVETRRSKPHPKIPSLTSKTYPQPPTD
jgi:hypothetical protein